MMVGFSDSLLSKANTTGKNLFLFMVGDRVSDAVTDKDITNTLQVLI